MSANLLGEGVKIVRQQSPTCCFLVHGFELQPHPPKFLGVLLSVCLSVCLWHSQDYPLSENLADKHEQSG